jgi:ketosteroid isomerase-like protein
VEAPSTPTEAVRSLNRAWRGEDASALTALLTPEAVILTAGLQVVAEGRDQIVESYLAFAREAEVTGFEETDWREHRVGYTAMVAYRYWIEYRRADELRRDEGSEMFLLVNDQSSWRAACRLLLS